MSESPIFNSMRASCGKRRSPISILHITFTRDVSATARALGVDYSKGIPSQVKTASGVVMAHMIMLDSVDVGGITVNRVQASVLEGPHPEMVLLGTSYLQHVEMREKDGILMLMRKF